MSGNSADRRRKWGVQGDWTPGGYTRVTEATLAEDPKDRSTGNKRIDKKHKQRKITRTGHEGEEYPPSKGGPMGKGIPQSWCGQT